MTCGSTPTRSPPPRAPLAPDRDRQTRAQTIGAWLRGEFTPAEPDCPGFDLMVVSPYVRARETAAHLALPDTAWVGNRALRERDWGDIGSMAREEFEQVPRFVENARMRRHDPLYWVAPGGESIAQIAEDRVRNVLDSLHREASDQRVLCVTHRELMWAMRLVLERWSDEEFTAATATLTTASATARRSTTHAPTPAAAASLPASPGSAPPRLTRSATGPGRSRSARGAPSPAGPRATRICSAASMMSPTSTPTTPPDHPAPASAGRQADDADERTQP